MIVPEGQTSDDPPYNKRCFTERTMLSYVTEADQYWNWSLVWTGDYDYVEHHCLKEEYQKMDTDLNLAYRKYLSAPGNRIKKISEAREWLRARNERCEFKEGDDPLRLDNFVCLMNKDYDRIQWLGKATS